MTKLIDYANAPIFGIDGKGNVTEWNQTARRLTGYTKDEVLGRNLVDTYITPEYQDAVRQVFTDALEGNEMANFEFPLFTKDGQLAEKARCVFDKDNKINTDNSEIVAKHHWCGSWWQEVGK